jgi:hypothetical protein
MAQGGSRCRDRIPGRDNSPVGKIKHSAQGIEAKGRASNPGFAVTLPESCRNSDSFGKRVWIVRRQGQDVWHRDAVQDKAGECAG